MILPEELERASFCRDLSYDHQKALAELAQLKELDADVTLFHEGDQTSLFYVVLSGEIQLTVQTNQGEAPLQTIPPGELVGWSPALLHGPATATAKTLSPCRLAIFEMTKIANLAQDDPVFGRDFFRQVAKVLAQRLQATRRQFAGRG